MALDLAVTIAMKGCSKPDMDLATINTNIGKGCKVHSKAYGFTSSKEKFYETIESLFNATQD